MSQLIAISSQDERVVKSSGSNNDVYLDFNFYSNQDLTGFYIAIESFNMPNLVYPVNANNCNVGFYENNGSTLRSCALSQRTYTGDELASELQSKMNASGAANTYTVSYDINTSRLNIETTIPDTFKFIWPARAAYKVLGLASTDDAFQSAKATTQIRLDGTQYIDIVSNIGNSMSTDGRNTILARIPMKAGFNEVLYWQNKNLDSTKFYITSDNFNSMNIRICDDTGNLYPISITSDWSMTLRLSAE